MKNLFSLALLLLAVFSLQAKDGYDVSYSNTETGVYALTFNINDYAIDNATYDGVTFSTLLFSNNVNTEQKGWAELPILSTGVQLPALKDVDVSVNYEKYIDITLEYPLLPSKGVIYRNQDRSTYSAWRPL